MNRNALTIPFSFLLYLLLQVLFFRKLVLFDMAFCLPYIGFLLFLPITLSPMILMALGFALGLSLDFFQNSQGLHASAAVLIGFVRNFWLGRITPQGGYDVAGERPFKTLGLQWFLSYLIPLLLIHHIVLFFIEAGGFTMIGLTLGKAFSSFLFTLFALFLYRFVLAAR